MNFEAWVVPFISAGYPLGEVHHEVIVQTPESFQDSLRGKETEMHLKHASSMWQTVHHLLATKYQWHRWTWHELRCSHMTLDKSLTSLSLSFLIRYLGAEYLPYIQQV